MLSSAAVCCHPLPLAHLLTDSCITPLPPPKLIPLTPTGQSKLANIMFTYELARRLQPANAGSSAVGSITANALHPGVVRTELSRYLISDPDSFSGKLLTLLATPFTLSPEQVRGAWGGEADSLQSAH